MASNTNIIIPFGSSTTNIGEAGLVGICKNVAGTTMVVGMKVDVADEEKVTITLEDTALGQIPSKDMAQWFMREVIKALVKKDDGNPHTASTPPPRTISNVVVSAN